MEARNRFSWTDRSDEEPEHHAGGVRELRAPADRMMPSARRRPAGQGRKALELRPKAPKRPVDTAIGPAHLAPLYAVEASTHPVEPAPKADHALLVPPGLAEQLRERQGELLAKLARLEGEARVEDEDARPRYSNHPADEAVALFDRAGRDAVARVLREDIAQVDRALDRLAAGRYGLCDDCHQPIPPKRLEVRPTATLCVSCQGQREARAARTHQMAH